MTRQEFLDYIRTNTKPGDWTLFHDHIRYGTRDGPCPVCWVSRQVGRLELASLLRWWDEYEAIGLHRSDAQAIAMNADDMREYSEEARQELLKACHLAA